MPHQLLFLNPVLQRNIQTTVRRGRKWLDVNINDLVTIAKTGEEDQVLAQAQIVGLGVCVARDIPDRVLAIEHDPACRDRDGLHKAMKRAYPEYRSSNVVTIVFFQIVTTY